MDRLHVATWMMKHECLFPARFVVWWVGYGPFKIFTNKLNDDDRRWAVDSAKRLGYVPDKGGD